MSRNPVFALGLFLVTTLAVPTAADAACGGSGRRLMKGKPGDTFLTAAGPAKTITYRWIATDVEGAGDCGIMARTSTPGIRIECGYGCPGSEWGTEMGVGPAISDGFEQEWSFRVRATKLSPPAAGVVELYINRGCDVCPPDYQLLGTTNVYIGPVTETTFTATAPAAPITHTFAIDHPYANANPDARVFVTPRAEGPKNDHVIGVWYSPLTQRWSVFNQDFAPIVAGARFTVHVEANDAQTPVHVATAASVVGNVTYIDHPVANGNPLAQIVVTSNYNPGPIAGVHDEKLGVFYSHSRARWGIYNEDRSPMPVGRAFNVAIMGHSDIYTAVQVSGAWLGISPRPPIVTHVYNPTGEIPRYYTRNVGASYGVDILPVWRMFDLAGGYSDDGVWFNAWHPAAVQ